MLGHGAYWGMDHMAGNRDEKFVAVSGSCRMVCVLWRVCVSGVQDQGGADTSASNTACCELGHATSTWIGWPRVASVFSSWINNLKFENSAVA